ncbi:hypothetical protein A0H81_09973 [Grifola frondosa]|uniref:Uncharacterized protein n=1 Tax=Grifola frondosa TaxID=5627 RepID=A0A1C7M5X8_GRIFR|nr:hypothetical protein A0H81_09973 [Grifola frondosa]
MMVKNVSHDEDRRRTDGAASHNHPFDFDGCFSKKASPKLDTVGEADSGKTESSVLARLGREDEGVEGKLCIEGKWKNCEHRDSMEVNLARRADSGCRAGIDKERAGNSLSRAGERGGVRHGEGLGEGRSRRELDLRRPRVLRVKGGRTFVDDARCLFGGGGGVRKQEDIVEEGEETDGG